MAAVPLLPPAPKQYQMDSAYCHPVTNPAHYWYYGIAWAVLALVVGFYFFWRAEAIANRRRWAMPVE